MTAFVLGTILAAAALAAQSAPAPSLQRIGGRIQDPRKIKNVTPEYPAEARRAGLAGVVVLECTISEKGEVVDAVVLRGVPPLTDAARKAVLRWKYTPTLLEGVAVPVIMTVTVNFKMETADLRGLLASLESRNEHVRAAAARNLAILRIGGTISGADVRDAIEALSPLADKDESPRVRAAAAWSLARLGGRPLTPGIAGTVPDRTERRDLAWGVFVNPDGCCNALDEDGRLVFVVSAGRRDLAVESAPIGAPRLVRPVEGDFDAEVGVDRLPDPGPAVLRGSYRGAGLLLWKDELNYVRLESAAYRLSASTSAPRGGAPHSEVRYALFEARRDGRPVGGLAPADIRLRDEPVELRLTRREKRIVGYVRQEGRDWRQVGEIALDLPGTLEVGLAAVSVAKSSLRVGFDGFRLGPPGGAVPLGDPQAEAAPAETAVAAEAPPPASERAPAPAEGDSPPKVVRQTRPQYPPAAFAGKVEGTVLVEILIDESGRVARSRVIQSVPGLDEAALACVTDWSFEPARKGGKAVPTIAHVPVHFRIDR